MFKLRHGKSCLQDEQEHDLYLTFERLGVTFWTPTETRYYVLSIVYQFWEQAWQKLYDFCVFLTIIVLFIVELYIVVMFNISTTHSNKCNKHKKMSPTHAIQQ